MAPVSEVPEARHTPDFGEAAAAGVSAQSLVVLLRLIQRAQSARSIAELGFTLVNETLTLVGYRQSALFLPDGGGRLRLATASGLTSVAEDSPYAVWLGGFAKSFPRAPGVHGMEFGSAPPEHADGWAEWLPDQLLIVPLHTQDGELLGVAMYARDEPCNEAERVLMEVLHRQYAYCLGSLGRRRHPMRRWLTSVPRSRWLQWGIPVVALALLVPVRLSSLAPAEVVALNAVAVSSPQDGVVAHFHVRPNTAVRAGELLFSLDDTTLKSRREVASKALSIAKADALIAQQRAFDDLKSKGELATAFGQVREKEAELALIETALARVDVHADRDGIAIFADANDWMGRPVQTGERVMQLADPRDAGILVWLPAADAINLKAGAPLRLFLHTQPLQPLSGTLLQTSYQVVPSPEGVSAYRLRGRFDSGPGSGAGGSALPRIGLRGTARVSGDWATLGYYVFRRPLAALREWTGM